MNIGSCPVRPGDSQGGQVQQRPGEDRDMS